MCEESPVERCAAVCWEETKTHLNAVLGAPTPQEDDFYQVISRLIRDQVSSAQLFVEGGGLVQVQGRGTQDDPLTIVVLPIKFANTQTATVSGQGTAADPFSVSVNTQDVQVTSGDVTTTVVDLQPPIGALSHHNKHYTVKAIPFKLSAGEGVRLDGDGYDSPMTISFTDQTATTLVSGDSKTTRVTKQGDVYSVAALPVKMLPGDNTEIRGDGYEIPYQVTARVVVKSTTPSTLVVSGMVRPSLR